MLKIIRKYFFYSDEEVKQREEEGMYTYEDGIIHGLPLGMLLSYVLIHLISFLMSL